MCVHARYIHHHEDECNEVYDTEYAHYDVLVEYCTDRKSNEQTQWSAHTSTSAREVDVPNQVIVNWLVPLLPILTQVSCIPPVTVETPICEHGQLCKKIEVGVEYDIENEKPSVCSWNSHVKSTL